MESNPQAEGFRLTTGSLFQHREDLACVTIPAPITWDDCSFGSHLCENLGLCRFQLYTFHWWAFLQGIENSIPQQPCLFTKNHELDCPVASNERGQPTWPFQWFYAHSAKIASGIVACLLWVFLSLPRKQLGFVKKHSGQRCRILGPCWNWLHSA